MDDASSYHERSNSRELLQAILDYTTAVVYVKDRAGQYVLINQRYAELFDLDEASVVGQTDFDLWPRETAEAFRENDQRIIEGDGPVEFEELVPHDDGLHTYFSVKFPIRDGSGHAWATGGFSTDITARKRSEERIQAQNRELEALASSERQALEQLKETQNRLVQIERLSVLGQTVAGVAHEINNPLAFVLNNLAVISRRAESALDGAARDGERVELHQLLDDTRDGLRRIEQVVADLRGFARDGDTGFQEYDLNAGIRSTLNVARPHAAHRDVTVELALGELPTIVGSPTKINQVILNLLVNAIDASPPGGVVTIETHPTDSGVAVEITDQGPGVPPELRARIFEPFFTTKPAGSGTGLGLSLSSSMVAEHGGNVTLADTKSGARFVVTLPINPPSSDET